WPSCSAPIVGTKPTLLRPRRQAPTPALVGSVRIVTGSDGSVSTENYRSRFSPSPVLQVRLRSKIRLPPAASPPQAGGGQAWRAGGEKGRRERTRSGELCPCPFFHLPLMGRAGR